MMRSWFRLAIVFASASAVCLGCDENLGTQPQPNATRRGETGRTSDARAGQTTAVPPMRTTGRSSKPSSARREGRIGPAPLAQRAILKGHASGIGAIAFSKDGKMLATGDGQGEIKLWDVATGKERATLEGHDKWVHCLVFSPDGKTLVSGAGIPLDRPRAKGVKFWDVAIGKEVGAPAGRTGYVYSVAFSPDGKTLAYGNAFGFVKLLDVATKKERASLETGQAVTSVAFAPDGKTLASGGMGGWLYVWDAATGKQLHSFKGKGLANSCLRYSPGGEGIVFCNYNGLSIQAWQPNAGTDRVVFETTLDGERVGGFAFASGGEFAAVQTMHGTLQLRNATTWKLLSSQPTFSDATIIALSPDGKFAATGGLDRTVKVWDVTKLLQP